MVLDLVSGVHEEGECQVRVHFVLSAGNEYSTFFFPHPWSTEVPGPGIKYEPQL